MYTSMLGIQIDHMYPSENAVLVHSEQSKTSDMFFKQSKKTA